MPDRRYPQYPTGRQQSIPFTQAAPQSQYYHPAFEQMMAQNLMQTQQRHDAVTQQMSESQAQLGQLPHLHTDLVQDRIQGYTQDLHNIIDEYGGNVSQAGSAITRRISQEAADPFYQRQTKLAQYAEQEQEAIDKAGGLQNVFLPKGRVIDQDPDAPMSQFQPVVVEQDDFMGIIDDIGDNIKPNLIQQGLSSSEAEQALGMIRDNEVERLSAEQLEAVARAGYHSFRAAAPSTQYAPETHWTRNPEETVNVMMSRWAGKYLTGDRHSSTLRNIPQHVFEGSGREGDLLYSPGMIRGAREEENRHQIERKYESFTSDLRDLHALEEDLARFEGVDEAITKPRANIVRDLKRGDDINTYLTIAARTGNAYVRSLIEEEGGEYRIKPNAQVDTQLHSSPEDAIADHLAKISDRSVVERSLERTQDSIEQFKEEHPFYRELVENEGLSHMEAIQVAQEYEVNSSMIHHTDYEIPNQDVRDAIIRSIARNDDSFGDVRYTRSGKGGRVREVVEENEAKNVLAETNNIEAIGVLPATGEITISVEHDDKFKTLYFPADVLPTNEAKMLKDVSQFLENQRSAGEKEGRATISGITYSFEKQYDPVDRKIAPVYKAELPNGEVYKATSEQEFFEHLIQEGFLKRLRTLGYHERTQPTRL